METKQYTTIDKSEWPMRGQWDSEPDKLQWPDEATGLPCLIVRGPVGALCGYVGVSEGHPLFGKDYSACVWPDRHEEHEKDGYHYSCTPSAALSVHGGITFARGCHTASKEDFERMKSRIPERQKEAAKFPVGDSAMWLREWVPVLDNYEAYKAHCEEVTICHVGDDLRPVWWFGFDCSHCDDLSPSYDRSWNRGMYRDLQYVQKECASLAQQLAAIRTDLATGKAE